MISAKSSDKMGNKELSIQRWYWTIPLVCLCVVAVGQDVEIDTSFRPPRYDVELAQFRAFPQSQEDIIFVGNSITYYIDWAELLGDSRIKNRGISGDNTFGILERIRDVAAGRPAMIFIMIGINDLARNYPQGMILANFERIIKTVRLESPRTLVYIQSILPSNTNYVKAATHYDKAKEILQLNAALQSLCHGNGIFYLDLHSEFADEKGQLRKEFTYDGVHLTIEGYKHWAEMIRSILSE